MKTLLLIIMVSNSRFYRETPQYAVEYPTEEACQKVAATYPNKGIEYQTAICIPKVVLPKQGNDSK